MATVTIHQAKTHLSRLIARARAGEEVIIARGDVPVARLEPMEAPPRRRQFGAMRGRARTGDDFFAPLPPEEIEAWDQ